MTIDKGIYIRNVYYMLSYAFQELGRSHYADINAEEFEHVHDMLAEILSHGVAFQVKKGLHREYVERHEQLTTLRGKLDISATLSEQVARRRRLGCEFDELSVDNTLNRIVKSTMIQLTRHPEVKPETKKKLSKLMLFFSEVSEVDLYQVAWERLHFDRNCRTYQTLCFICYFLSHELLLTTDDGRHRMEHFSDKHMCRLYEKFLLEYYKRHHPRLHPVAKQIDWNIQNDVSTTNLLPLMQSDIYLSYGHKTLIIDAKYYQKSLQTRFDKPTIHSQNLYQILAYVSNEDQRHEGNVDGILLYAKTSEEITPDGQIVTHDGNTIHFKTLDLNQEFKQIRKQLDDIARSTFGMEIMKEE